VVEDGKPHRRGLGVGGSGHDQLSKTRDTEGDVRGSVTWKKRTRFEEKVVNKSVSSLEGESGERK